MGGKIVAVVQLDGASGENELARDIAMHVAAERPNFINIEDVSADVRSTQENIFREEIKNKPANIVDKILVGKMHAFYEKCCLYLQQYVKDPDVTIAQLLDNQGKQKKQSLKVSTMICWAIEQETFR
jgi:elongation factor Ts